MTIAGHNYPKSLVNRAKAYSYLNLHDSAIMDLKNASEFNPDYYRLIADAYRKLNQNDSAIRYYELFLDNYPDSLTIAHKLSLLKNGR